MNANAETRRWMLEVVRGREVGRRFALPFGSAVLGNAPGNGQGIDLSGQEGDSPRKMAGRQAVVEQTRTGPVLNDLESPGGTFVNRRRILPGQGQPLREGDLIQLGSVQLRLIVESEPMSTRADRQPPRSEARPEPAPAAPAPTRTPAAAVGPLAFPIRGGPVCRSWDDFITVSAQRWESLRDELTSGRLASYLVSTGRGELAPRADAPGSADDRLDAWLGTLPTNRPAKPELEVHPRALIARATPGARARQTFRISNVGFRLLRSKVRIEPAGTAWLSVSSTYVNEFTTVDETVVTVDLSPPDPSPGNLAASLVVESNGGSARVSIRVEPPGRRPEEPIGHADAIEQGEWSVDRILGRASEWLARRSVRARLIGGTLAGLAVRLVIVLLSGFSSMATLPGPGALLAVIGGALGAAAGLKRGGARDVPACGFAGAFGGLMLSALLVASCQAIEPILGASLSSKPVAVIMLWGVLGALLGGISTILVPERPSGQGGAK